MTDTKLTSEEREEAENAMVQFLEELPTMSKEKLIPIIDKLRTSNDLHLVELGRHLEDNYANWNIIKLHKGE